MNRLVMNPTIRHQRSKFDMSNTLITTFNAGKLIPLGDPIEVLPGDTFRIAVNSFIRMQTLVKAPMDNLDLDIWAFFVPNRIVWEHFEQFMGDNDQGPWTEGQVEYNIPQITAPTGGWAEKTVADYFGLPTKVGNISVSHIPFRCYCQIFNDWFRNQNAQQFAYINKGDATTTGTNGNNWITDAITGGELLPVAKKPDYFTTGLPNAQKGEPVTIPLGTTAPITNNAEATNLFSPSWRNSTGGLINNPSSILAGEGARANMTLTGNTDTSAVKNVAYLSLNADLSEATASTINTLRQAFQIQKYLERNAIFGTRYREFLKGHFGVTSPDARLQVSEFLGGKTIPISITPIVQTSGSNDNTTPQGNIAGMSATGDESYLFTKSFVEHGYIILLGAVRVHKHTYQQGIRKLWSRKSRFDLYDPLFANLGNQATLNKEIFAQGTEEDEEVFNYQEYGADYRFRPNIVTGEIRSNASATQQIWSFADYYTQLPRYSGEWMEENKSNIDKTLAVPSTTADQFIANFYFRITAVRPMPLYSMPGFIDHH